MCAAAMLLSGCISRANARYGGKEPTCAALCQHYEECAGIDDDGVHTACLAECREIFYEDGKADKQSLADFQRLRCKDAVAFVEGSGGPPGNQATKHRPQASSKQPARSHP